MARHIILLAVLIMLASVVSCKRTPDPDVDAEVEPPSEELHRPDVNAEVEPPGDELHRHVAKLGGKIERLEEFKDKTRYKVDLRGLKITDDDLAILAKTDGIDTLDLTLTPITDAGIAHINAMVDLQSVDLTGTKITDAGLALLHPERKWVQVDLANTAVTAKGVQSLIERVRMATIGRIAAGDKSQYRVVERYLYGGLSQRTLMVGDTLYGFQFNKKASGNLQVPEPTPVDFNFDASRLATTYYHRDGPAGQVLGRFDWFPAVKNEPEGRSDPRSPTSLVGSLAPSLGFPVNALSALWSEPAIGVIRITTGTLAAYGRPLQQIHFYNSTPELKAFSVPPKGQPPQFTFIHDAMQRGCSVKVFDGEEFTTLTKNGPKKFYSALFVEITSTDLRDINTQLFTKEAVANLMGSLTDHGVLCLHVSHRYYDMVPPLADAAKSLGLCWSFGEDKGGKNDFGKSAHFGSNWLIIARQPANLEHLKDTASITWTVPPSTGKYLWHDGDKIDLEPLRRKAAK